MRSVDGKTCTGPCGEARPLADFAKDARRKDGHRSVCKTCDRKATAARRADRAVGRRPGALVLAPKFPTPPEPSSSPETLKSDAHAGEVGSYIEAAEKFVAALSPPADDADALLVRNLRGLAAQADIASYRTPTDELSRELSTLNGAMLRVQRELAATRIVKAKAQPVDEKPARSAANY